MMVESGQLGGQGMISIFITTAAAVLVTFIPFVCLCLFLVTSTCNLDGVS